MAVSRVAVQWWERWQCSGRKIMLLVIGHVWVAAVGRPNLVMLIWSPLRWQSAGGSAVVRKVAVQW